MIFKRNHYWRISYVPYNSFAKFANESFEFHRRVIKMGHSLLIVHIYILPRAILYVFNGIYKQVTHIFVYRKLMLDNNEKKNSILMGAITHEVFLCLASNLKSNLNGIFRRCYKMKFKYSWIKSMLYSGMRLCGKHWTCLLLFMAHIYIYVCENEHCVNSSFTCFLWKIIDITFADSCTKMKFKQSF